MTIATTEPTITEHEAAQVERANASSATPVVFVHGLWLLPSSWDRWVTLFEEAGYVALTPGWPDDPETVAEAREHPEVFAGKGIGEIADYEEAIIRRLDRKPVIIGHSFGGLLTMILAGRGLAAASVAISPAPFRGVLPLPIAALRTASVALRNPANWNRAVPLSYEQFRYSFANVVGEDEAKELYLGYSVPGAGEPLFQAASANFNPWSEAKVNSTNPERGPMLIVSADSDHTVPWAIANASYKKQKRNKGVTEIVKMPGRGHALTIDAGWREVAEKALEFVKRFTASKRKVRDLRSSTPMMQSVAGPSLLTSVPTIDEVLHDHASELGHDFIAYRNHVYRVVNLCARHCERAMVELEKIAVAAVFHDLGIWTNQHVRLHRAVRRARTRVPRRPRSGGLDRRDRRDDRGPPQDHALARQSRLARRAIPTSRLDRRDARAENIRPSTSVHRVGVRWVAECRVSLAPVGTDARLVPEASADAVADGETLTRPSRAKPH